VSLERSRNRELSELVTHHVLVDALNVNVYDVVNCRYIVLSQAALDKLTEVLGS